MNLYSKNIVELQALFDEVASKWNVTVVEGIANNSFKLEDGLPWLEVEGLKNKTEAKKFLKELASTLGINMLFNRFEQRDVKTLCAFFDLNPDYLDENGINAVLPSLSENPDSLEYMEDFGEFIRPV